MVALVVLVVVVVVVVLVVAVGEAGFTDLGPSDEEGETRCKARKSPAQRREKARR